MAPGKVSGAFLMDFGHQRGHPFWEMTLLPSSGSPKDQMSREIRLTCVILYGGWRLWSSLAALVVQLGSELALTAR